MWRDLLGIVGGFQNFIWCLAIGMVFLALVTILGFSRQGITHPVLGWYALFLNHKKVCVAAVVLLFVRVFFVIFLAFAAEAFSLTHGFVYVLLTLLLWFVLFRAGYILYDLFYSCGILSIAYLLFLLAQETNKILPRTGMKVLYVMVAVLLVLVAVGQFFTAVAAIMQEETYKTEQEVKLKRRSLCLLPCLFLAVLLPYYLVGHMDSIVLKQSAYQYAEGEKIEYPAGGKITKADNGCVVTADDSGTLLAQTLLYERESGRVIFPSVCSIVRPKLQLTNRVNPLSILSQSEGTMQIVNGDTTVLVEEFFLFDGRDTYYFNEGTILEWEDETVVLSSFSQVEVIYNKSVAVLNYETEEYSVYETGDCFCIATLSGTEQINLSTDILYRENGQEQMLFLQPALLSDLE